MGEVEALERQPEVLADQRATGEHGDVGEHRLATVAEARGLGSTDVEHAAELVDDQRGEGVAVDILGDDQKRLARLCDLLEEREELPQIGDLLLVDQDQGVSQLTIHLRGAVDEVGRDIPLVKLHAVDEADGGFGRLPLLDGDHAILAHLLESLGDEVADRTVVVGGDGTDLGDLLGAFDLLRHLVEADGGSGNGLLDAAADGRRIGAGGHHSRSLAEDRAGEDRGRGRAVTGQVGGLRSDLVNELGAHVLEGVLEIDFLADGDAVLRDRRATERLVDDHVAAGRPHRHRHGAGELLDAFQELGTGLVVEQQLLGHGTISSGAWLCLGKSVVWRGSRPRPAANAVGPGGA